MIQNEGTLDEIVDEGFEELISLSQQKNWEYVTQKHNVLVSSRHKVRNSELRLRTVFFCGDSSFCVLMVLGVRLTILRIEMKYSVLFSLEVGIHFTFFYFQNRLVISVL